MKINKNEFIKPSFKGVEMSPLSSVLYTLQNNDMIKASAVDLFCTDSQRTMLEFKNRGKNAGIEMGFREFTGTFIVGFSSALFAFLTSKVLSKFYKPDIKVNPASWATNNSLDVFKNVYELSDKTPEGYVKEALNSLKGRVGKDIKAFKDIESEKTSSVIKNITGLIENRNIDKKEFKKQLNSIQNQIINVLGADNQIFIQSKDKELNANLNHTLRDMVDLGHNVFFNKNTDYQSALSKLKSLNKSRVGIAIPLSLFLAISNQYINRRMTKKRVGINNFVGENGYENNVKNQNENTKEKGLFIKKLLAAGVFILMLSSVMGVKRIDELVKKLEFDGPATGGHTIKTIYGTLILGRIFASTSSTELRETITRDYLGFLNWLVLGDFVAKRVGQILDKKQKNLFNVSNSTKDVSPVKHWLKDVSLKSQKEILAAGGNVKKNLRNLNIAQISGIAYSAIMLGILLPKFNIWMTKRNKKTNQNIMQENPKTNFKGISFDEFQSKVKLS